MTRPFFPSRATSAAPVERPAPRPTQAQRHIASTARMMLREAMQAIRPEDMAEALSDELVERLGAARAEQIGERIGTLAHLKGRA